MPAIAGSATRRDRVFALRAGPWLDRVAITTPPDADAADRLEGLGRALTASDCWQTFSDAVMVLRRHPVPTLGIVGSFDAAEQARIDALQDQLLSPLPWARYVDYAEAERGCEILAQRLTDHFGGDLAEVRFAAIPRGGLIVLGMLSYLLRLRPEQLLPAADANTTTVLVDDCALSGGRLRLTLRDHHHGGPVVFAPLYSPPALRAAIVAAEPAILACLSAHDLPDLAPAKQGDAYTEWHRRWSARATQEYWIGDPEHVCFPWSEPDIVLWNPVTKHAEDAWHVVPPERCLKTRARAEGSRAPLQVLVEPTGPLLPPADAIWAALDGDVVVAAGGATVRLSGAAATIWDAILATGRADAAASQLASRFAVDDQRAAHDVATLVTQLRDRGVLTFG